MGMAAPVYYSADMVRALPEDGKRYETVHGELLVTPAPRGVHQYVVGELHVRLHAYLRRHPVGQVLMSPADISWAADVLVQPDLFVVRADEARTFEWSAMKHLLLAVEVLSPSSGRADRFTKRRVYQEYGVPAYWVVDIEARAIEVWTPEATFPVVERERVIWRPEGSADSLEIALAEILPPVWPPTSPY
jgi:Uma2 family endonuclease